MTSELIIDAQPKEVTIALLEDQKLEVLRWQHLRRKSEENHAGTQCMFRRCGS